MTRELHISAQVSAALHDILLTLDKHGIGEQTRTDVLAIAYSLKDQIIHV